MGLLRRVKQRYFALSTKFWTAFQSLAFLFRLNMAPAGVGLTEVIFADMPEVISLEPVDAGYEGLIEIALKIQSFMPNDYFPCAWLGRISFAGGYDLVDGNVGLPPLTIKTSDEVDVRSGLVSLAFEAKKREKVR